MPIAVLVHGGFHGGWCWKKVQHLLVADGWTVYAPSLTGLADREHLAAREVGIETHVQDVLRLIECEELDNIVLCAHSYGGMVITPVADRMPERIANLVYLDAVLPESGQSLFDLLGDSQGIPAKMQGLADESGDGWWIPPIFNAVEFGVSDPADVEWVDRRLTGHPIHTFDEPVELTGAWESIKTKTNVHCERWSITHTDSLTERLEADAAWTTYRIDSGHDVMISHPERVREILVAGR
jgi:pimeloyl-ACP methyl ester carboxylesterase